MKRKVVLALCTVALATSAVAAGRSGTFGEAVKARLLAYASPAAAAAPTAPSQKPAPGKPGATQQAAAHPVPENAVYNEFFYHVNFLRKKADKEEKGGKDARQLRAFYKRQAKLDDAQNDKVSKAASDLEHKLDLMDAKARKVIDKFRADVQAMDIKPGQKMPDPPAQLKTMQAERDALVMSAKESLRANLGDEAFGRLDQYVRQNIAPKMTAQRFDRPRPDNPNRPR
ncbi:MAG TPA: hypothetical protein VGP08_09285 [Pyrinomonadaceae bacterium]|jgi:hypothetical protein|nr:hypothetical protein [Pyrinomonadaceae bacterium]